MSFYSGKEQLFITSDLRLIYLVDIINCTDRSKIITFPLDIPQSLLTEYFVYLYVPLSDLYKSTRNWYYSSFLTVVVIHCHTKRFWDILILHPVFNIMSPLEMSHLSLSMSYAVLLSFILCNSSLCNIYLYLLSLKLLWRTESKANWFKSFNLVLLSCGCLRRRYVNHWSACFAIYESKNFLAIPVHLCK